MKPAAGLAPRPAITRLRGRWLEELPASPLRYALTPAWLAMRCAVAWRDWAFGAGGWRRPQRLPCPVVSVGNLTVGGTGKTPAVRLVGEVLHELGQRPVVLSRGYRGSDGANEEAQLVGDVPVLTDPRRVAAGRRAITDLKATCLVLDDGFQHRQLHRDLDIVLIDATDPWGGGALLPLGRLREPRRALSRAQLLWLTRTDLCAGPALAALTTELTAFGRPLIASTQGVATLAGLDGRAHLADAAATGPVLLSCGLGNPGGFEATARHAGLAVAGALRWPDHYHYAESDLRELMARAAALGARPVVSAKDAVKLLRLATAQQAGAILVLHAQPQLVGDGRERLSAALRAVLPGGRA